VSEEANLAIESAIYQGDYDYLSFRLSDDFIRGYVDRPVNWGFPVGGGNTLGEITFYATYSRVKADGTKERWHEACRRVVEGVYSILKDHCVRNRTPWNHAKAARAAEDMYERMFTFRWTPPGRGIWMMGTRFVHEEGSAALQNCAFVSTKTLGPRNPTMPFERLMEMSMLGVGVGFDTLGAGGLTIQQPKGDPVVHLIEDSREGWVASVGSLLRTYFTKDQRPIHFDYSEIRPAGTPIVRFGGTAAGPAVLERLHDSLRKVLDAEVGNEITSRIITDVMNLEGKCVVAGNVRRSAEIAFGLPEDKDFISLKDWTQPENAARLNYEDGTGWGHLSNNSVFADVEGDYDHLIPMIEVNGEPGLYFLDLARSHGRLGDPANDRDYRVAGANPCVEQSLEDQECCTLVETFPTNCDDFEDYRRTIKVAYLYAKAVTLLPTHWPETNEVMQRNRRIGCSASGLAQFVERHGWTTLRQWLDGGYREVTSRDRQYAEWLGVRESIKMTSVKPSGTVSLLAGVTPGVHWPVAGEDYLRRVRYSKDAAFLPILAAAGYHIEPSVSDPEADVVVTYPTSGPQVRGERDVPVWEKMHLAAMLQEVWADNMVSATFSFWPHETAQIGPAIHAFKGKLKAMSFLPKTDGEQAYAQMPYEAVSEERFEHLRTGISRIDTEALYNTTFDAIGERYCSNDSCEVPQR
jgi:ribonucleoside-triphosphate reductase (thioredoxin)